MLIETRNLSYVYMPGTPFQVEALRDVALGVEKGAFVGVIGQTGSGKSTFVQHLNGLLKPTAGQVLVDGKDIWSPGSDLRRLRSRIALLFQYPEHQLFEETVFKDVAFGPRNLGLEGDELSSRVCLSLELMGLDYNQYKERSPFNLSGGEKRRVAMAGILAISPEVIILDEPTAGLDPIGRRILLQQVGKLHKEKEITVILVTHNLEEIARIADTILVFAGGRIVLQGTPGEVFSSSEQLKNYDLDLPPLTQLLQALKRNGKNVRTDLFTVDEVAAEILCRLGGEG